MSDILSFLADPRGRADRRGYALGLVGVGLICVVAAGFGPFVLIGVLVAAWVLVSASARRLRDLGAPGWLAPIPFLVALALGAAAVWFSMVTQAFCQGYCAGARPSGIAALDWVERSAGPIIAWTFLTFTGLLLTIPGRRRSGSGDLPARSG